MDPSLTSSAEQSLERRLLAVVAHPDDESFGCGSLLAHASASGYVVTVCCATRGEAGEAAPGSVPEGQSLAAVREAELHRAAGILGVQSVCVLDFVDSGMGGAPPAGSLCDAPAADVVAAVTRLVEATRPDVVVTLDGSDGHRDHAAIRDATLDAVRRADWRTPDVYLSCLHRDLMRRWADLLAARDPGSDYLSLRELGTPASAITAAVDTTAQLTTREAAIKAHASQVSPFEGLPPDLRTAFLCTDHLQRVELPWPGSRPEPFG